MIFGNILAKGSQLKETISFLVTQKTLTHLVLFRFLGSSLVVIASSWNFDKIPHTCFEKNRTVTFSSRTQSLHLITAIIWFIGSIQVHLPQLAGNKLIHFKSLTCDLRNFHSKTIWVHFSGDSRVKNVARLAFEPTCMAADLISFSASSYICDFSLPSNWWPERQPASFVNLLVYSWLECSNFHSVV